MLYAPLPAIDLVKPLAGTFLGSLTPMPVGEDVWRDGVALPSFVGNEPGGWPGAPCFSDYESDWATLLEDSAFVLDDKAQTFASCDNWVFDPFTIYHLLDSSLGGGGGTSPEQQDRFIGYAENWMDVQASAGIARAFYRGAPSDGLVVGAAGRNPIPRTAAVDLTALMGTPAAVSPETAVANLLSAYYGCAFAGGAVLHVPPLILPFLISKGIVAQVGQRFLGPGGVVVVSDPGMPSNRELFSDGSTSDSVDFPGSSIGGNYDLAAEGQAWAFVTGGVYVATGAIQTPLTAAGQVFDVRQNRWLYVLEQRAIFAWDPECSFAVAVFAPSPAASEP